MGNSPSWVTEVFCPTLGTIICNVMWLSPLSAVLESRKKRSLGKLNPVPFAITVANCVAWTMYGCMRRDWFVFWSNSTGLCLGIFYSISSLALLNLKKADVLRFNIMTALLVGSAVFWCLMAMVACIVYNDDPASREQGIRFIGTIGMAFGLAYYVSPLSTLLTILRTRDSSSLYLPMIVTSFFNALMWVIYGFVAKNDVALWLPNAAGCILCALQFGFRLTIPAAGIKYATVESDTAVLVQQKPSPEPIQSPMHTLDDDDNTFQEEKDKDHLFSGNTTVESTKSDNNRDSV